MTPEAAAILADTHLPAETGACLGRFFGWGAAPTVDAYCDLFAPTGTLLDADMDRPIGGLEIRDSIARVLQLLPDFRFAPVRVVYDGPHVFVLAANRASLGDRTLMWDAIYALTLVGDRIAAGRRYYDQAALLTGAETFAVAPAGRATNGEGVTPVRRAAAPTLASAERTAAWNRRDFGALWTTIGSPRVHLAGVARPLIAGSEIDAGLTAFAARSEGLRLAPGAVVQTRYGTAAEWIGRIGGEAQARRFALVEMWSPLPEPGDWRLLFNTLGL